MTVAIEILFWKSDEFDFSLSNDGITSIRKEIDDKKKVMKIEMK